MLCLGESGVDCDVGQVGPSALHQCHVRGRKGGGGGRVGGCRLTRGYHGISLPQMVSLNMFISFNKNIGIIILSREQ